MPVSPKPPGNPADTADQVHALLREQRPDLIRFAVLQLRDRGLAEDVVQEALMAALEGAPRFAGRSSVKTWVFSILKRKIIDALRSRRREQPFSQLTDAGEDDSRLDRLFDERGFWATEHRPHRWTEPEESLEQQQFWQIFEICLDHLPQRTSRVFMMREFLGLKTGEICQELAITASNCWAILHRARAGLRLCLEENWFTRD